MSKPLASVVIPCFNVAATVAETIASVQAQTVSEFEIVAVDNNCTDGTVQILRNISAAEPRLRIVEQPVQGLSAARNAGIKSAQGEFVAFLDADDLWDREYLARHLENLADPRVDVSYARIRKIDNDGRPAGSETKPRLQGLSAADLLKSNPCTALIVVRRSAFQRVGLFDEDLRSVEDQEWLFRALVRGGRLRGIDRVLASCRITPGGLSADLETMLISHGKLLDAANRIAPELVAAHRTRSRGAMLRYCARRALEHGKGRGEALRYLKEMLMVAPGLVLFEPMATARAMAAVLVGSGVQTPADTGVTPAAREV